VRSHSNDLGVAEGLASWAITHHLNINYSYFCHVRPNNDVRILWTVLAALFTSRVLSLSAWKRSVDSDLSSRGRWDTLERLLRGIWALSLWVISWAIWAIWWLLVRWSQDSHALGPLAHHHSGGCRRPAAESSIRQWSCFPASCWRCFAWEKCSHSVGLVDWWLHWDFHQILKEKCLFRYLSSCCWRFRLIIKPNLHSWRHLISDSCLNVLFHGLLHCWKQNLRFACHYGRSLEIFGRSEKLKSTLSYLFSVFLDWNFGHLEKFETKCCGSTLKIAKRIQRCFSFATLSVA